MQCCSRFFRSGEGMQETQSFGEVRKNPVLFQRKVIPVFDLVWILVTMLSVGLFVLGWPLRLAELATPTPLIAGGLEQAGLSSLAWAGGMLSAETLLMLVCTMVGFSLYFQRRKEVVIYITSLSLITFGTGILNVLDALSAGFPELEPVARFQKALLWSLLLLIFYIFPNGKFQPAWTRWAYFGWLLFTWSWFFFPESAHNPSRHGALTTPWVFFAYLVWLGSGLVVLFLRSSKSSAYEERQQTKWVISGFAMAVLITFLEELPSMLDKTLVDHSTPQGINYALYSTMIFTIGVLFVPIGIGLSIQKKRLWQIDYLINRGLVYGMMTIIIILGLYGIIQGLTSILQETTNVHFERFSILLSIFIGIYIVRPLQHWLQNLIDRKLYGIQIQYKNRSKKTTRQFQIAEKDWTNQVVGKYQIVKLLRGGKSGQVYHALQITTGRPVAVKFLHQYLAVIPEQRKAFVAEAKTLGSLDHPNIIRMLDYGEEGETTCYIVMEYLSNQTLADKIKENSTISMDEAQYLLNKIASALDYSHGKGIIHLDVKPGNILLRPTSANPYGYSPVLTDFGIAKSVNQENGVTIGQVTGTFDYISPEQIHSPTKVNHLADIYSLGVVMYQMVTGQLPFQTHHAAAMLIAHINQPPPNPIVINPELSAKTAYAIIRAMAKNPAERFYQASLFAQAICS